MKRRELEHVIRAAADLVDDEEVVVLGSQAILGQYPEAPAELRVSMEADLYPKNHPERWDLIDGSIGEGSPFHQVFGYYAQGVGEETAVVPSGWKHRLVRVCNENTRQVVGWCLEAHDLVLSKYVAGREKDFVFNRAAIRAGLVDHHELLHRIEQLPVDATIKEIVRSRVLADTRIKGPPAKI